jgi:hypothetical protein
MSVFFLDGMDRMLDELYPFGISSATAELIDFRVSKIVEPNY